MYLFVCLSGLGVGTDRGLTDFSSCDVRVLRRFIPFVPYLCCHSPVLQHVKLMVCFKTVFLKYALPGVLYPQ